MARRVACVLAHPDDDTFGVAGSLARIGGDDVDVTVVMTTSGDAGQIADPTLATRETLGSVREAEDRASWVALGVEPEIHFLRYPDGGVAEIAREALVAVYLDLLQRAAPDVVVTFGPEGITGHADHVAVGAATTAAFHAARAAGADGFHRLLHICFPQSRLDRFNELLRERGMPAIDSTQPYQPRGVPDETIGMVVDCSSVYDRKLEALRAHRTQAELDDVPFEAWPELLGTEAFVIGFPQPDSGGPTLNGLFDGLPGS